MPGDAFEVGKDAIAFFDAQGVDRVFENAAIIHEAYSSCGTGRTGDVCSVTGALRFRHALINTLSTLLPKCDRGLLPIAGRPVIAKSLNAGVARHGHRAIAADIAVNAAPVRARLARPNDAKCLMGRTRLP